MTIAASAVTLATVGELIGVLATIVVVAAIPPLRRVVLRSLRGRGAAAAVGLLLLGAVGSVGFARLQTREVDVARTVWPYALGFIAMATVAAAATGIARWLGRRLQPEAWAIHIASDPEVEPPRELERLFSTVTLVAAVLAILANVVVVAYGSALEKAVGIR